MSLLRDAGPLTVAAGLAFFLGLALVVLGVLWPRLRRGDRADRGRRGGGEHLGAAFQRVLPSVNDSQEQNLRLAGITPGSYATQRVLSLLFGIVAGVAIVVLTGRGPAGIVVVLILTVGIGWALPLLGVRDTAKNARAELDQIIRIWVVLVAQQVSAGADPGQAMLDAARVGKRPAWRLLHRFLLAAQQQRRQPWEGLVDVMDRYGIYSLTPIVSALGLAADRGTRISEAVLTAAKSLWENTISAEREKASRRAQIVVLPATGVALALAGILIYPPFTSLTGGGVTGLTG